MESTKNLAAALLAAQKGIQAVSKGSTNAFHKYKYVSADDMIADARVALHEAGLVARRVGWTLTPQEDGGVCVTMTMRLDHPESGENFTDTVQFPAYPEKGRPMDKAVAGSLTSAMSYWLRDLLLLPRVDENEMDKRDDSKYDPAKRPTRSQRSDPAQIPGVSRGVPAREPVPVDPKPNIAREALRKLIQGWARVNAKEADRQVVKLAEAWGFSRDNPPQSSDWESMWNYAETAHSENDELGFIDYVEQVRAQMAAQLQAAPLTTTDQGDTQQQATPAA